MRRRVAGGQDVGHLMLSDREKVFDYIYEHGVWLNGGNESTLSGLGSELRATEVVRSGLHEMLASIGSQSLLDVGCGDFTWMQQVDLGGRDYIGIDIVEGVIADNIERFSSERRAFRCVDAVSQDLPIADVVLCREILFHLSFADGHRLLRNIQRSGASHIIATSDTATAFNSNIRTGDYRVLNLNRGPYRFPAPLSWIADDGVVPGRRLGVWKLNEISGPDWRTEGVQVGRP